MGPLEVYDYRFEGVKYFKYQVSIVTQDTMRFRMLLFETPSNPEE